MNHSGQYPEASWCRSEEVGYRAQIRIVSRAPDDFNELNCLSPVLTSGMTPQSHSEEGHCEDIGQVWTFRHSRSTIRPAAKALLGNPI